MQVQGGQQAATQQQPAPQQPTQQQPPQPRRPNPFETVPTAPAQPAPEHKAQPPKLEQPANAPVQQAKPAQPGATAPPEDIIESIGFRGSRRVPQDTLRALIYTKKGDRYDEERLHRDFTALWNTGRFDDIRLEREPGATGWILTYVVTERPVVRSI